MEPPWHFEDNNYETGPADAAVPIIAIRSSPSVGDNHHMAQH